MRKAIVGLTVVLGLALIALASVAIAVSVASAQDGRVDAPCAGYAVDVQQDADGYDMLLTVPLPPAGFQYVYLEVDGRTEIGVEGDGNNVFRMPFTVFDIGSEHHYYGSSFTRSVGDDAGLVIYSCTDIGMFEIKL